MVPWKLASPCADEEFNCQIFEPTAVLALHFQIFVTVSREGTYLSNFFTLLPVKLREELSSPFDPFCPFSLPRTQVSTRVQRGLWHSLEMWISRWKKPSVMEL